jgi:TonB family protein
MDAVDQVLLQRARQQRGGRLWGGLAGAVVLHGGLLAAALLLASWKPPAPALDYVPVTLLPAQALGVERPRARPRPPAPVPAAPAPPAAAEPPPQSKPAPRAESKPPERREPEHEIPPEVERRPALHNVQEQSLPRPERSKPPERQPPSPRDSGRGSAAQRAAGKRMPERAASPSPGPAGPGGLADVGKGEEVGRRGSASGNPLGSSAFGSSIAGLEDPDFGYGYYIDRLLQLIDANWTRPPVGGEVRTVVFFRIQKSGQITDLHVEQPSGYNAFDLAALRAVQNAAPFPALPASYRHNSLGVNLIVH